MEKAYRHHRQFCGDGRCFHLALLLVYSIECGLKALIMKEHNAENYDDLREEYQVHHDFMLALTHLHAPPELQATWTRIETSHSRPPQQRVLPKDLHQTFRYGIPISNHPEVVAKLQRILNWLKDRLP